MNVERLEARIHDRTNAARRRHDERALAYDPTLRPIARYHCYRMARAGEIFHEAPDGEGLEDRLVKHDYPRLPKASGQRFCHECGADLRWLAEPRYCTECGVSLSPETARSAVSGENLAYRGYFGRLRDDPDIDQLAEQIVQGWLDSPGHRENLLRDRFDREAIGVVVDRSEGLELYITQNFS